MKTQKALYRELFHFWIKIFAVAFAMGVVSGVTLSYQLGTNWPLFSAKVGNVLGPLFGFEIFTAFFLEASFLGIMLFGWNRVSARMHLLSTGTVAAGTLFSAFWILSANSWMHTPSGFWQAPDGTFRPSSWLQIIFNPSFPYRGLHMITAAYLTTATVLTGVGSYYLLRDRFPLHGKFMVKTGLFLMLGLGVFQLFMGDQHGLNTLKHQPAKIAAIEGIWETEQGAPLILFGLPNTRSETTDYAVKIPYLSSLILTHQWTGEVKGLKHWPREERPPVVVVFFAFRIMVGIGLLMIATGLWGVWLYRSKKLWQTRWFQRWCMCFTPAGFIAILAGWFVTEVGRQPYVIYGLLKTSEAGPTTLSTTTLLFSLSAFILVYTLVFGAGLYYALHLVVRGPVKTPSTDVFGTHGLKNPLPLVNDTSLPSNHV